MMYSLIHITLLGAATLGLWLVRSRISIAAACFLVFPLPATLFSLYAAPNPLPSLVADSAASDCARRPSSSADSASSDTPDEASKSEDAGKSEDQAKSDEAGKTNRSGADCPPPRDTSRSQILFAVISVNYLTVLIGFAAGLLARKPLPRRTADKGRGSPPSR